jgi:hypothetical protein
MPRKVRRPHPDITSQNSGAWSSCTASRSGADRRSRAGPRTCRTVPRRGPERVSSCSHDARVLTCRRRSIGELRHADIMSRKHLVEGEALSVPLHTQSSQSSTLKTSFKTKQHERWNASCRNNITTESIPKHSNLNVICIAMIARALAQPM